MMEDLLKPATYSYLLEKIKEQVPECSEIQNIIPVSGGDINDTFKLSCHNSSFFIKLNSAVKFPGIFESEAAGLKEMAKAPGVKTPEVLGYFEGDEQTVLLLEYIEEGSKPSDFWETFGRTMVQMHQTSRSKFGWDIDNYMGSLPQSNRNHGEWTEFFIMERLEPQFALAFDGSYFSSGERQMMEKIFSKLEYYMPKEKPALVHGDLWGGNYLVGPSGEPVLIDPATYYGHREIDIAMMHLFGGFSQDLFEIYNSEYPLEKGWKERLDLYNLYPLLIHVNLFGGGYALQVKNILRRFV